MLMLLLLLRMKKEIQLLLYLTKSNYVLVVSDIEMVKAPIEEFGQANYICLTIVTSQPTKTSPRPRLGDTKLNSFHLFYDLSSHVDGVLVTSCHNLLGLSIQIVAWGDLSSPPPLLW